MHKGLLNPTPVLVHLFCGGIDMLGAGENTDRAYEWGKRKEGKGVRRACYVYDHYRCELSQGLLQVVF